MSFTRVRVPFAPNSIIARLQLARNSLLQIRSIALLSRSLLFQMALSAQERFTAVEVTQQCVDPHEFAGAVTLVAEAKQVLAIETVGFAAINGNKPIQPNTRLPLNSKE